MYNTLKKYELMKELGIPVLEQDIDWLVYDGDGTWYERGNVDRTLHEETVASLLERACREWLEEQEMYVYLEIDRYMNEDIKTFCVRFSKRYVICPNAATYDIAQVEALKHCLQERNSNEIPN